MRKVGWYAIDKSTTLESNKSLGRNSHHCQRLTHLLGAVNQDGDGW